MIIAPIEDMGSKKGRHSPIAFHDVQMFFQGQWSVNHHKSGGDGIPSRHGFFERPYENVR